MSRSDPKRRRKSPESPRYRSLQEDLADLDDDDDYMPRKIVTPSPKKKHVVTPKPMVEKPNPKPKLNPTEQYIKRKVKDPGHKKAMEELKGILVHYNAHARAHDALKSLSTQQQRKSCITSFYEYLRTIKK